MPTTERITELSVSNLRCLADVHLGLGPLTVGIGENGAGKSSLVEAAWLLKLSVTDGFMQDVYREHLGKAGLFRRGASSLTLGVRCEGDGPPLRYELELTDVGNGLAVTREELVVLEGSSHVPVLVRDRDTATVHDRNKTEAWNVDPTATVLSGIRPRVHTQAAIVRMTQALSNIEVHLPFSSVPRWASRLSRAEPVMRDSVVLQPVDRLDFAAANLANCFHALRNAKSTTHWATTMDYVRLGLGDHVESINTLADPSGGRLGLTVKIRGVDQQEPAFALSDGMLSYLAYVAMLRLEAPTSLLVLDEVETHLHPRLINRLLDFMNDISDRTTVLAFTHSDRLLDALPNPLESVVLLELDERRATAVRRPEPEALKLWLEKFAGLGASRSAGHQQSLFGVAP